MTETDSSTTAEPQNAESLQQAQSDDLRIITVFGSARVVEQDEVYQQSMALGRALAEAGYAVMTGGYHGVMEAASRGAAEAGGQVVGVTVAALSRFRGIEANRWVSSETQYETIAERRTHLITQSHGYVTMPGGVGTLIEMTETWELLRTTALSPRPNIVFGSFWRPVVDHLLQSPYVSDEDEAFVQFADDINATISIIRDMLGS